MLKLSLKFQTIKHYSEHSRNFESLSVILVRFACVYVFFKNFCIVLSLSTLHITWFEQICSQPISSMLQDLDQVLIDVH
jgi:hypothetical protein